MEKLLAPHDQTFWLYIIMITIYIAASDHDWLHVTLLQQGSSIIAICTSTIATGIATQ